MADVLPPCAHRGTPTGETLTCSTCAGRVRLKVFPCAVFGTCTAAVRQPGRGCCRRCPALKPPPPAAGGLFSFEFK